MPTLINSQAHLSINGKILDKVELLRFEVARSRVALLLLKTKLGTDRIRHLLADETKKSDELFHKWDRESDGKFLPSTADFTADGGTAAGFMKWFGTAKEAQLLGGMPEHYLIVQSESKQEVIETFGGWGLPVKLQHRVHAEPRGSDGHDRVR